MFMKKTLISCLSLMLSVLMVLTAAPFAFAVSDVVFDYEIINGEVTVYGLAEELPDSFGGTIVIPATIEGYPVKRIGPDAFSGNEKITGAVLPDGLVEIGYNLFMDTPYFDNDANRDKGALYNGRYLLDYHYDYEKADFKVKDGTVLIADYACSGNYSMQTLAVPASVKYIGEGAFMSCENLFEVSLPDGIESIGEDAFLGSALTANEKYIYNNALYIGKYLVMIDVSGTNFEEYYVKEGTELIADRVFCDSSSPLIYIPASVRKIGDNCFGNNMYLKRFSVAAENGNYCNDANGVLFTKDMKTLVAYPGAKPAATYTIPASVEVIGPAAFSYAILLKTMLLPENVKKIYDDSFEMCVFEHLEIYGLEEIPASAFYHCPLETLVLGDSVKKIGDYAFDSNALTEFNVPAGIEDLGALSLYYVENLTVSPESPYFTAVDGVLFSKDKKKLVLYPLGKTDEKYTVPDGTQVIGKSAFDNSEVIEVTLSDSVKEIEENGFAYSGLEKINFGSGLEIIGENAFQGYRLEGDFVLPEGLKTIGDRAFASNFMTTVQLPSTLEKMGEKVFEECYSLEEIRVASGNAHFVADSGVLYDKALTELIAYPLGKPEETLVIPDTVSKIAERTFAYSNLVEVTLPSALKTIPKGLFDTSMVYRVVMPEGIEKIENYAFYNCLYLRDIKFPSTLTSIGDAAFYCCMNLAEINIPANLTEIGASAFEGCEVLEKITVDGANTAFTDQDGVLFTKDKKQLIIYPAGKVGKKYTVPTGTEVIGESAFTCSMNLEEVVIPDGVKEIGDSAFEGAGNLHVICVPSSVEEIGDWAFDTYSNYTYVYYAGTEEEWSDATWDSYIGDMAVIKFGKTGPDFFDKIEMAYNDFLISIIVFLRFLFGNY